MSLPDLPEGARMWAVATPEDEATRKSGYSNVRAMLDDEGNYAFEGLPLGEYTIRIDGRLSGTAKKPYVTARLADANTKLSVSRGGETVKDLTVTELKLQE